MIILNIDPVWTWDHFLFGLTYAIVASFIFLFLVLIFFKPKILVSPHICKGRLNDTDTTIYYFIKIINISLFSAHDIKIDLELVDKYVAENSQMNTRQTQLTLVCDRGSHIPGYRPSWWRKNAPYAVRIRSTENLTELLADDHKSIRVKISLRHGLTGLVKVKTKEYTDPSHIKSGRFKYGLNFGILN